MLCFDARHVHLRSREHFEGKLAASIDAPLFDQAHRSRVSWLGLHLLVLNLIYSGATRPVTLDQPDAHVESANALLQQPRCVVRPACGAQRAQCNQPALLRSNSRIGSVNTQVR